MAIILFNFSIFLVFKLLSSLGFSYIANTLPMASVSKIVSHLIFFRKQKINDETIYPF